MPQAARRHAGMQFAYLPAVRLPAGGPTGFDARPDGPRQAPPAASGRAEIAGAKNRNRA